MTPEPRTSRLPEAFLAHALVAFLSICGPCVVFCKDVLGGLGLDLLLFSLINNMTPEAVIGV